MSRAARLIAALCLAGTLSGCATGYVLRAAYEEAKLLWRREPIDTLLADNPDAATRAKLELVLEVRRFAGDHLGLRVGGSYASIASVDQSQVVHVVSAAPRDRLVPYTWWFPIVGDVPYRGYFEQADADALAAELEREGYDTYVRSAVAFSTLGWFDDPLLSTMLRLDHVRLAETVIHELLHTTIYVPGQAAFNESFATFVGHRGAEQFFARRGDLASAQLAAARWADALTFSAFLTRLIASLDAAYARGITAPERAALFAQARQEFRGQQWLSDEYAYFDRRPINNAVLLQDRVYADRLAVFEEVYANSADDLRVAIETIRARADGAPDAYAALP